MFKEDILARHSSSSIFRFNSTQCNTNPPTRADSFIGTQEAPVEFHPSKKESGTALYMETEQRQQNGTKSERTRTAGGASRPGQEQGPPSQALHRPAHAGTPRPETPNKQRQPSRATPSASEFEQADGTELRSPHLVSKVRETSGRSRSERCRSPEIESSLCAKDEKISPSSRNSAERKASTSVN